MSDHIPEPTLVAQKVDHWADSQIRSAAKYDNRDLLDESSMHDLHRLAASIYAMGHADGEMAERQRTDAQMRRAKDFAQRGGVS